MKLMENMSLWRCFKCNADNDYTNPVRCWKCNHKKPKMSTVKRLLTLRKKKEQSIKDNTRKEVIAKIDNIEPKSDVIMEFDISKLQTD